MGNDLEFTNNNNKLHKVVSMHVKPTFRDVISFEEWCQDDVRHNPNGPAVIEYNLDGDVVDIQFFVNGKLHNETGPAHLVINNNTVSVAAWYTHGALDREGAPAYESYQRSGIVLHEEFYKDNKLHNLDGPAVINCRDLRYSKWYFNGKNIPKEHLHAFDGMEPYSPEWEFTLEML